MKIRELLNRLLSLPRRFWFRVHRTQTTDYASQANEMARRNLAAVLKKRKRRNRSDPIAQCLEACFPLKGSEESSRRLRDALERFKGDKPPRS